MPLCHEFLQVFLIKNWMVVVQPDRIKEEEKEKKTFKLPQVLQ